MSHQDKDHCQVHLNAEGLKQALQWLLGQVNWSRIGWREDCRWTSCVRVGIKACPSFTSLDRAHKWL